MGEKKRPPTADLERFLTDHHGAAISGLTPVGGGFWSSAYTYECNDQALVLRLADDAEGYRMDQVAHSFAGPGLPVPEVLSIGSAFDGAFAVSRRATGRFLEDLVLGDFLYDGAWCTFWGPWHPGIASVDVWSRTLAAGNDDNSLTDAAVRHHCYELHIGVQHLAWCAWTENRSELQAVADRTAEVLATGPKSDG